METLRALSQDQGVIRFVKFILVGVLNTAFGYLLYALLIFLGIAPQPALAIAFFVGVLWNYLTHARLVFDQNGFNRIPAYAISYLLIYVLNSGALALLLRAGLHPLLAQAVLLPVIAVISFLLISKALTGRFPFSKADT